MVRIADRNFILIFSHPVHGRRFVAPDVERVDAFEDKFLIHFLPRFIGY